MDARKAASHRGGVVTDAGVPKPLIIPFGDVAPTLAEGVYIAPGAAVIGDVHLGEDSSVFFNAVVRGDVGKIRIGRRTNIQDLSMVHVTTDHADTFVGDEVTVGHRVVLHGCRVGDGCLIGMGSVVLDLAEVGEGAVVGAGALVPPGMKIPPRMLALGVPAKVVRPVSDSERTLGVDGAAAYLAMAQQYRRQGV